MLIESPNQFCDRFVRVAAKNDSTLAEIYLGLLGPNLFSENPTTWLEPLKNLGTVVNAMGTLKTRFFDSSVTRHRPIRSLLTIKNIVSTTGISEPQAALIAYLFGTIGVGGFDNAFDYRKHVECGAGFIPNTEAMLSAVLAGKFFTEHFSILVNRAINNAKGLVTQGAAETVRVFSFGDTTMDDVVSEFETQLSQVSRIATQGASAACNFDADYYIDDVKRAVALYVYHPPKTDENRKQLDLIIDDVKYLSRIANIRADIDEEPARIVPLASQPVAPGVVKRAAEFLRTIGQERMAVYQPTTGAEYIRKRKPLRLVKSARAAVLAPSVVLDSRPLATVIEKRASHYGYEIVPNQFQTGKLFSYAQEEAKAVSQMFDSVIDLFAVAPPTKSDYAKSVAKTWLKDLATLPRAVLLDLLIETQDEDCVRLEEGALSYAVRGDWVALSQITRMHQLMTMGQRGTTSSLANAALIIMVSQQFTDLNCEYTTAVGTGISDATSREIDPEWLDSVLADPDGKGKTKGIGLREVVATTSDVYTPVEASEVGKASEKVESMRVPELWRYLGLTKKRFTVLEDLQQRARVDRLSAAVSALLSAKTSSTVDDLVVAYVHHVVQRAKDMFGLYASTLMEEGGASFADDRHSRTYIRALNICHSMTCVSLLITAVSQAQPVLASTMATIFAWAKAYVKNTNIQLFDIGELPKGVLHE